MRNFLSKKSIRATAPCASFASWAFALLALFASSVPFPSNLFAADISYPNEPLRNDPLEDGRAVYPIRDDLPVSCGNTLTVDYVPGGRVVDPDSAIAGWTREGTSEKNTLRFQNGHVRRYVLGGFSLEGNVCDNTVGFSDGTAADAAIGKLCGGYSWNGDVSRNSVTISGGNVVGDVYGGDADANGHARSNRVAITAGALSGFVNGGGVSGVGIARNNHVAISGGAVGMGVSGGFAHVATGSLPKSTEHDETRDTKRGGEKTNSVIENVVEISGKADIRGDVSGGFVLDSDGSANGNSLTISGGAIRGNVYGGRAFAGKADGNTVVISGGTIKDREEVVYGGYVHKPENARATGNTVTVSGSPDLKTITLYGNNLPTWRTDGNTLHFKGFRGSVRGLSHFQDVTVDKDSCVSVTGEGPHELCNVNNAGRLVFPNGEPVVFGKASGNPIEHPEAD